MDMRCSECERPARVLSAHVHAPTPYWELRCLKHDEEMPYGIALAELEIDPQRWVDHIYGKRWAQWSDFIGWAERLTGADLKYPDAMGRES